MTAGTSVAKQMIWKDVQLHRFQIASTIVCGVAALALLFAKREPFSVVGSVALFIALIYIGCLLPSTNILNERKKQTLPFMISLPISTMQYTTAKLASTVGIFMIPWLTFVIAAFWLIGVQSVFPHGADITHASVSRNVHHYRHDSGRRGGRLVHDGKCALQYFLWIDLVLSYPNAVARARSDGQSRGLEFSGTDIPVF
jgi:hypothetical protein